MNPTLMRTAFALAMAQGGAAAATESPALAATSTQQITRAGAQASAAGPDAFFTGRVRVDPVWPADKGISASGAQVTLSPAPALPGTPTPQASGWWWFRASAARRNGASRCRRSAPATWSGVRPA